MKTKEFILVICLALSISLSAQERGRASNPNSSVQVRTETKQVNVSTQKNSSSTSSIKNSRPVQNTKQKPDAVSHAHNSGIDRNGTHTDTKNKNLHPHDVAPSQNYKKMPKQGQPILPRKAEKKAVHIKHHKGDFYYKNGIFYKLHGKEYIVHRAYPGMRVKTIPEARRIVIGGVSFYYYYGTFYRYHNNVLEYEVVEPPVGAIVESIPDGYERLDIEGNTYYIANGVQYKAIIYKGQIWYEVIKVLD